MAAVRRISVLCALALVGCAAEGPRFDQVAASLPQSPGGARLLVYRDYDLAQSLAWVPIFVNGVELGGVGPGHVLVCDLPPGTYTTEARSEGLWPDQAKAVTVGAGQTVYAKIGSFRGVNPDTHGQELISTYVVMLQDTATGRRDVGPLWYTPCEHPLG
jgi:hypothetical protein